MYFYTTYLTIAVIAALWLLADVSHALATLAAVGAVATPHLTAVIRVTVLCGVAVVVHHTFVLAHTQLAGLVHLVQEKAQWALTN
jgi:hypothetical protein